MSSKKPVVLFNVQPWNCSLFSVIARNRGILEPLLISSFPGLDRSGVLARYQSAVTTGRSCMSPVNLSNDEMEDIIIRCRLLRELPFLTARRHVKWLAHFISLFLADLKPSSLVSEIKDQFFHDVLFRIADKYGIKLTALVPSLINGYCRVTIDGSSSKIRSSISLNEISTIRDLLTQNSYLPSYLPASKNIYLLYFKNYFLNCLRLLYFSVVCVSSRYKHTYHYWGGRVNLMCNVLEFPPFPPIIKYQLNKPKADLPLRKKIFLPLHFYPEATTDYWCEVRDSVLYIERLQFLICQLSPHFDIIAKEHPSSIGHRKRSFYKSFNNPHVFFVSPFLSSRSVINSCDAVLIWSGSVGIEAIIKGKPILYASNKPYYDCFELNYSISDAVDVQAINKYIDEFVPVLEKDPTHSYTFFNHILQGCIPANFRNNGSFDPQNKSHLEEAIKLSEYLDI